jgi:hypothetical protein
MISRDSVELATIVSHSFNTFAFSRWFEKSFINPSPHFIGTMQLQLQTIVLALAAASTAQAGVIQREAACSSYTIINTRGTGELQGPSSGFRQMNSNIQKQVPGGKVYNTMYPADFSQVSTAGTNDIVKKIERTLSTNPQECFILEGYSQGAAATTNAMPKLTGASFDAVKGVFLIGNPEHHKGLACNVDTEGGSKTKDVNGLSSFLGRIPDEWVSKTMDVCNFVSFQ